jgi:hypothetical protein
MRRYVTQTFVSSHQACSPHIIWQEQTREIGHCLRKIWTALQERTDKLVGNLSSTFEVMLTLLIEL